MKKLIIASLSSLLILSASVNTVVAAIETDIDTEETAVETDGEQVVIYEDKNKTITAEVPAEMKDQYLKDLQNPVFVEKELANLQQLKQARASSEPSVKYFRKDDVIRIVDNIDSSQDWTKYLGIPLGGRALSAAIKKLSGVSVSSALISAGIGVASTIKQKNEQWWKDSLIMILRGEINAVKQTITPNPGPGYPQVYRELERV